MIKVFSTAQFLSSHYSNIENLAIREFVESRIRLKSSNTKRFSTKMFDISLASKIETSADQKYLKAINTYTGLNLDYLLILHKIK